MNEVYLAGFAVIVSIVLVYLFKAINLRKKIAVGVDINKLSQPKIAESAGISVLIALWVSIIALFFIQGFQQNIIYWLLLVSAFALIGFFDDIRPKFLHQTTPWLVRAVPIAIASLIFAFFYSPGWVLVLPFAFFIAGLASFENTFAGLNGWEAGSGFIISCFLAFLLRNSVYFLPALLLAACVFGLLFWNRFPARVLPGDSGTLLIGSGIAGLALVSMDLKLVFLTALFFVPHAVDFFLLKMLTNPKDPGQSKQRPYKLLKDGRLALPDYKDGRICYDFAKLVLRVFGPLKEWQVVAVIWGIVVINCLFFVFVFNAF